jgi:hypothetical protein
VLFIAPKLWGLHITSSKEGSRYSCSFHANPGSLNLIRSNLSPDTQHALRLACKSYWGLFRAGHSSYLFDRWGTAPQETPRFGDIPFGSPSATFVTWAYAQISSLSPPGTPPTANHDCVLRLERRVPGSAMTLRIVASRGAQSRNTHPTGPSERLLENRFRFYE